MIGGPGEVRTPDPMVANHVLSQLSYRPVVTRFIVAVESEFVKGKKKR